MESNELLKRLSTYSAISGYENELSQNIRELFLEYCDSVEVDRFFNVIGIKKGTTGKRKIMITAHYDEVGLLVSDIDDKGFLRITNMGGLDSKILLAQEVVVHGRKELYGIIGAKPPHLLKPEDASKAVKMETLYIDVGMTKERVSEYVSVGDAVTFKAVPFELQGNKISSKTVDNRGSMVSLIEIMKELNYMKHNSDIYFVATTQEETGCAGAITASYNLNPDMAIVIDACHGDMPDTPRDETYVLGRGPAIGFGPNLHKNLTRKLIDLSKKENIPYQIDIEPEDTGTEAWFTQVSRQGIPTLLISIPVRYMHTTIETVSMEDIRNAGKMTAAFIVKSETEMEELLCC